MAATLHCVRAFVLKNFECGATSSSRKTISCHKCCVLVEPTLSQKELQRSRQIIHYRELVLPKSSLKGLVCEQLANGRDDQWSYHCSHSSSVSSSPYSMKKVRDHQLHQPQGATYSTGLSKKETERRRKIGAANKGQVPWTKGRRWSEEHRKLISLRTTEALRDPKVRKKMLGHRQLHRQGSKDKISAALKKIWERRIVSVRSKQKVMQIWSNSIAEAAKGGDCSQDKLDWDSYKRIRSEMVSMYLWNREREQTIKKLKKAVAKVAAKKLQAAGTRAKIAAKKLQAAGSRKVQAAGTKTLEHEKLLLQKSDAQPTRVVVSARPKLKERLTKWHGRKKELETVISSRTRKRGSRKPPRSQMTAERRTELMLEAPSGPAAGA